MKTSLCADCGAKSFAGATDDGVSTRVVPADAGNLVVIAWNVTAASRAFTPVVFGEYDAREDDGSRRFSLHACVVAA